MSEPTKILICGDVHGNLSHQSYLFQVAVQQECDALFVLGDWGYWEHADGGNFPDAVSDLTQDLGIPLYWLDGNHENHTMLREKYLNNPVTVDEWGFVQIRPGLFHAPRALRWSWGGKRFLALGGAYSIDKDYRLESTRQLQEKVAIHNRFSDEKIDPGRMAMWWPEEEISDEETDRAVMGGKVDILLVHDKPIKSKPDWNRKAFEECLPNQRRIQRVVDACEPELLLHGHLHYRYTDVIGSLHQSGDSAVYTATQVEGLDCDDGFYRDGFDQLDPSYDPERSWWVLDLAKDEEHAS